MKNTVHCIGLLLCVIACNTNHSSKQPLSSQETMALPWDSILAQARGESLTMMMWQGDPYINDYMQEYVQAALKEQFDITLHISAGQGSQIVSTLSTEKEINKPVSDLDLLWINGETFYQLRQLDALLGPFTDKLPYAQYIDFENPFIAYDFQQPVAGYECPWGNVQMVLIYDSLRVPEPPATMQAMEIWFRENPGKFTMPTEFTGMTLLKAWLYALAEDPEELKGPFEAKKYQELSAQLWDFINRNKGYWWKEGKTFPNTLGQMHQLFADGELDFTMSNNDSEVDNKIAQGFFPHTSRAYALETGTIQNSHYLGIVGSTGHTAAALVTINFLISPEAQLQKLQPQVWGDGSILDLEKLPAEFKKKFQHVPGRRHAPSREELTPKALMEPAPEYMIRLYADFRKQVIES